MASPPLSSLTLWRDEDTHDGPTNMAIDEALLLTALAPVLRSYRWDGPAVSFGCFASLAAVRAAAPATHPLVRRWTGGGIVFHGDDWTYSLIVPAGESMAHLPTAGRYRSIHQALAAALADSGLPCALAAAPAPPLGGFCFSQPAPADILCDGRKIAGAAQRRSSHGLLHQGSVQGITPSADLAARLAQALADAPTESCPLDPAGFDLARRLSREKYSSTTWRERRP